MPRCQLHTENPASSPSTAQPGNFRRLRGPSKSIRHLRSRSNHRHTTQIWSSAETMQCHPTSLHQPTHHTQNRKRINRHRPNRGCETRRQPLAGSIPVRNDRFLRDTRQEMASRRTSSRGSQTHPSGQLSHWTVNGTQKPNEEIRSHHSYNTSVIFGRQRISLQFKRRCNHWHQTDPKHLCLSWPRNALWRQYLEEIKNRNTMDTSSVLLHQRIELTD